MHTPRKSFNLPEPDRRVLERLCQYDASCRDIALRAMIVLKSGLGENVDAICEELGVDPRTVYKWRRRYRDGGLDGIDDAPRLGHRKKLPADQLAALLGMP